MVGSKRVIVLAPSCVFPPTDGGSQVTVDLCNRLAQHASVKLLTRARQSIPQSKTLNVINFFSDSPTKFISPHTLLRLRNLFQAFRPHYCILIQPFYFIPAYLVSKLFQAKFIIYSLNIEYQRFSSLRRFWAGLLYPYELLAYQSAQLTLFISDVERISAITQFRLAKEKTCYLPHGITYRNPRESGHAVDLNRIRIIFFGNLTYEPNRLAVDAIVNEIAPRLSQYIRLPYQIEIAGAGFDVEQYTQKMLMNLNINFHGFVEDIENFISGADLMLNPVQSGGGIQTKIIDSVACGVTVIASHTGSLGLPISVFGDKLRVVDDKDWEGYCRLAYETSKHRSNVSTPTSFFEHYNGDTTIKNILELSK